MHTSKNASHTTTIFQLQQVDIILEAYSFTKLDYSIIVSNTTDKNRENLKNINKLEKGGLSGKPIEKITNEAISKFYKILKDKTKIIGVGGVSNVQDAFEKIISGATLVQLYTGMVYRGPRIASKISTELIDLLKNKGFKNVSEAIGTKN